MKMNKLNLYALVTAIITFISCDSSSTGPNAVKISGKVIDVLTNQPISGATITTLPQTQSTSTNSNGDFYLSVIPGDYQVIASKEGYSPSDVQVIASKNISINLQMLDINSNSGLIGYYPLDNSAEDKSQFQNHGQLLNTVATSNRKNNHNSALFFDNMATVSIPHTSHLVFDSLTSLTITGWVKFSITQDDFAGIIVKGSQKTNYPGFQLYIANGKYPAFEVSASNSQGSYINFIRCVGDIDIKDNQWHFLAGIVDVVNKKISLYVDGVKIAEQMTSGYLYPGYKNSEPILVGSERNKSVFFKGSIDDLQIYRLAMTQNQLVVLYNR